MSADEIKGMVEIYGQALETHAVKGSNSKYAGEPFVHEWEKKGTKIYGLPAGTIMILPDGDEYELSTRGVLMMSNKHHLWDVFEQ